MVDINTIKLKDNLQYLFALVFVKKSEEGGVLSETERRELHFFIENSPGANIKGNFESKFQKMKIEGKRTSNDEENTKKTLYTQRSRYDDWKKSTEFQKYE